MIEFPFIMYVPLLNYLVQWKLGATETEKKRKTNGDPLKCSQWQMLWPNWELIRTLRLCGLSLLPSSIYANRIWNGRSSLGAAMWKVTILTMIPWTVIVEVALHNRAFFHISVCSLKSVSLAQRHSFHTVK